MELEKWILDHDVGWELRPRYTKEADGVVKAGFELGLFARGPTLADDPGSPECRALHERLVSVARLAVPSALLPVSYVPFDTAFHLGPGRRPLPEIELLVDIGPLSEPNGSEEERALLRRLEEHLNQLGARPRGERSVLRRPVATASEPADNDRVGDRRHERSGCVFAKEEARPLSHAA